MTVSEQLLRDCPFCKAPMNRQEFINEPGKFYYWHPDGDCILERIEVADTPEAVAAWNRRSPPKAEHGADVSAEPVAFMDSNGIPYLDYWLRPLYSAETVADLQAQLSAAIERAEKAKGEVVRLRSALDHDPRAIVIAHRDGDHERLVRAVSKETHRADLAESRAAALEALAWEAVGRLDSHDREMGDFDARLAALSPKAEPVALDTGTGETK